MLEPHEIKSRLMLKKISQLDLADQTGISKSTVSAIINNTHILIPILYKILGENPFSYPDKKRKQKKTQ